MYIARNYYMICERCGGQYRYSNMREEWTGSWVCTRGCWEPRHPQDYVTGVEDNPSVPYSRPDIPQTMGETTNYGNVLIWTKTVILVSITGLSEDDPIGITMNNGAVHWTFIEDDPTAITGEPLLDSNEEFIYDSSGSIITTPGSFSGGYVTLNTPVSYLCDHGNTVYLPSINSESWSD